MLRTLSFLGLATFFLLEKRGIQSLSCWNLIELLRWNSFSIVFIQFVFLESIKANLNLIFCFSDFAYTYKTFHLLNCCFQLVQLSSKYPSFFFVLTYFCLEYLLFELLQFSLKILRFDTSSLHIISHPLKITLTEFQAILQSTTLALLNSKSFPQLKNHFIFLILWKFPRVGDKTINILEKKGGVSFICYQLPESHKPLLEW